MGTQVTLFNSGAAVPAHIAAAFAEHENVLPRETTPALTFRGGKWRIRQNGDEVLLTKKGDDGDAVPVPSVNIVVLNMNPKRSRTFYVGAYVTGENKSPDCWSSDGDRPDADCKTPCSSTCASCPNSAKGSKITANGKETTACSTVKRVAVVPASKLNMEPLLLKIPQTSMWDKNNQENEAEGFYAWDQYVDFLRARGVKHTAAVVTKVKFDPRVEYPKLLFNAVRWLEADEVSAVSPLVEAESVKKLLTGKLVENVDTSGDAPARIAAPAATVDDDDDGFGGTTQDDSAAKEAAAKADAEAKAAAKAAKTKAKAEAEAAAKAKAETEAAAAAKVATEKAKAAPPAEAKQPVPVGASLAALADEWDD
jgi:hypothetical protein